MDTFNLSIEIADVQPPSGPISNYVARIRLLLYVLYL